MKPGFSEWFFGMNITKEHIMDNPTPADDKSVFESFPEFHNFPSQWDLSEMETPAPSACSGQAEPAAEFPATHDAEETLIPVGEAYPLYGRDPFPKLRTFPVYWDLSR
jgi:hypothetical protein